MLEVERVMRLKMDEEYWWTASDILTSKQMTVNIQTKDIKQLNQPWLWDYEMKSNALHDSAAQLFLSDCLQFIPW